MHTPGSLHGGRGLGYNTVRPLIGTEIRNGGRVGTQGGLWILTQNRLYTIAGVLALIAALFWGWRWLRSGNPGLSPQELVQLALEAESPREREEAAARLASLREPAKPYLREVLAKTTTPGVRAECLRALAELYDYESMDAILRALDDESELVRGRAEACVERMLSIESPYHYNDPPAQRREAAEALKQYWEEHRHSPIFKKWLERLEEKRS